MARNERQLAVIPTSSRFKLPPGWRVRKIPRRDGFRVDRYFIEPGTGKQFRSLNEVQRHVNRDDDFPPARKLRPNRSRKTPNRMYHQSYGYEGITYERKVNRKLDSGQKGNNMAIVAYGGRAASVEPFTLPDGWYVEEVARKKHPQGKNSMWKDKYYHEIETGRKFRSMIAVQRYLAEMEEDAPLSEADEQIKENEPLAKVYRLENRYNDCTPKKKSIAGESKKESSLIAPPMEVKWVLTNPNSETWTPFISETLVPESVKEQWTSRFITYMNDGSSCA